MTDFIYKGNTVVFIEKETGIIIRIMNKYGFRWFWSDGFQNKWLKVKEAAIIEKEIQEGQNKHVFINLIKI